MGGRQVLRLAPCALRGELPLQRKNNARTRTPTRTRNRFLSQLVFGVRESASRGLQSPEEKYELAFFSGPPRTEVRGSPKRRAESSRGVLQKYWLDAYSVSWRIGAYSHCRGRVFPEGDSGSVPGLL